MITTNIGIIVFSLALTYILTGHVQVTSAAPKSPMTSGSLTSLEESFLDKIDNQVEGIGNRRHVYQTKGQNDFTGLGKLKTKRSYSGLGCRGMFHVAIFSKLENLCDQCYEMFKIPEIHQLCRSDCFGSTFFKSCVNSLLMKEEERIYDKMISIVG